VDICYIIPSLVFFIKAKSGNPEFDPQGWSRPQGSSWTLGAKLTHRGENPSCVRPTILLNNRVRSRLMWTKRWMLIPRGSKFIPGGQVYP
jgi:hypothetical protein